MLLLDDGCYANMYTNLTKATADKRWKMISASLRLQSNAPWSPSHYPSKGVFFPQTVYCWGSQCFPQTFTTMAKDTKKLALSTVV